MSKPKTPKGGTVEIKGLVIPVEWDSRGELIGVAVSAYDETIYLVDMTGKGKGLLAQVQREVVVAAEIRVSERGAKTLHIRDFKPTGRPRTTGRR